MRMVLATQYGHKRGQSLPNRCVHNVPIIIIGIVRDRIRMLDDAATVGLGNRSYLVVAEDWHDLNLHHHHHHYNTTSTTIVVVPLILVMMGKSIWILLLLCSKKVVH